MTTASSIAAKSLARMASAFTHLRAQAGQLGMNLQVWDRAGEPAGPLHLGCRFCRLSPGHTGCLTAMRELAGTILISGRPGQAQSAVACCLLGVPIYQRRRLIGSATVCFPPRELAEDAEAFARLCDRLEIDRLAAEKLARSACRHGLAEAKNLLLTLHRMLRREQELLIAQEELANLSVNLATTYEELSLLYRISGSMRVTSPAREFVQNICRELREVMNISAAASVIYASPPAVDRDIVVVAGQIALEPPQLLLLAGKCLRPHFARGNRALLENRFEPPPGTDLPPVIRNLIAVPLTAGESLTGMLIGLNKTGDFDSVDQKLINAIGNQAAVFLSNNRLYADLQDLLMGVLHALTESIDAKDPYTRGHSQRVALIAKRLAEECGLGAADVQRIYLAGLLHDVGKIGVPEEVLLKTGRLTDEEYEKVKRHPAIGAKILSGIRQLEGVIDGILTHHERPDGRGYPQGLSGDQLPMEGRILGLADGFDAMTSDRTYRDALPLETAVKELQTHAGTQFDADLVRRFLAMDLRRFMDELREPAKAVLSPCRPEEVDA